MQIWVGCDATTGSGEIVLDENESAWIGLDEAELQLELYLYYWLQQDPPDSYLY